MTRTGSWGTSSDEPRKLEVVLWAIALKSAQQEIIQSLPTWVFKSSV